MAWLGRSLGDSVSSLTGHLSSLTKDILTEGTEEVSGRYEISLSIKYENHAFSLKYNSFIILIV